MASHQVLKDQLIEMGFDDKLIDKTLTKLGPKATIESALESLERQQSGGQLSDDESDKETTAGTDGTLKLRADGGSAAEIQSPEEIEKRRLAYEEKIKQRRLEREEKEKEEEVKREVKRRVEGKGMGKMKEELEQVQRARLAEDMRREKAADKAAKDEILRRIAQDREDHKRRNAPVVNQTPDGIVASVPVATVAPMTPITAKSCSANGKCRLAIKLLDGRQLVQEFEAKEPLSAVRAFVIVQSSMDGQISFVMPPSAAFSEDDMEKPLNVLGLCPSARVHVIRR